MTTDSKTTDSEPDSSPQAESDTHAKLVAELNQARQQNNELMETLDNVLQRDNDLNLTPSVLDSPNVNDYHASNIVAAIMTGTPIERIIGGVSEEAVCFASWRLARRMEQASVIFDQHPELLDGPYKDCLRRFDSLMKGDPIPEDQPQPEAGKSSNGSLFIDDAPNAEQGPIQNEFKPQWEQDIHDPNEWMGNGPAAPGLAASHG